MKKNILYIVVFLSALEVNAQERVTKSSLVGKWQIATVSMPNLMYYDVKKDSFSTNANADTFIIPKEFEGKRKLQIEEINRETAAERKKDMTESFIRGGQPLMYVFDGNGLLRFGFDMQKMDSCQYSLDEQNAILTMNYLKKNEVNSSKELTSGVKIINNILFLENGTMPAKVTMEFRKLD